MKRIGLYLGFAPEGGGAFQYAQSVLAAVARLPADQYEAVVAYAHPEWARKLGEYDTILSPIPVREALAERVIRFVLREGLPLRLWHSIAPRVHLLTRRLLDEKCDLWVFPAQDVLTYALPAPTVGVIHDLMHRHEARFPEVGSRSIVRRRDRHYRNLCTHARAVLVDSQVGRRHVVAAYAIDGKRIHVLPYVPPEYIYQRQTPEDFDSRYELPDRFIFYPAQFWEHKNHIRLLHALATVRPTLPDLHLVLVGSEQNALVGVMRTIEQLQLTDRVHVLGYVPDHDMPAFYHHALALVMPTFFGPTNIPPLEALAMGCPMAVSNIYAMPEQVGDAALLFDPNSVEEISSAISRLATDSALRERLSIAARSRAQRWGQAQFDERFQQIVEAAIAA